MPGGREVVPLERGRTAFGGRELKPIPHDRPIAIMWRSQTVKLRRWMEMFVDQKRTVDRSFEEVRPAFLMRPLPWLHELVKGSIEHGYSATTHLGLGALSKRVWVRLGDPLVTSRRLVAPIRVTATGPHGLFPQLDANIEILATGTDEVEVRLVGTYRPPFGKTGEAIDRMLLHHLAEATITNFMDEIVARFDHPTFPASVAEGTS